jgi:hypothetical protein
MKQRSIERALSVTFVLSLILTQARFWLVLDWRHLTLAYVAIFLSSVLLAIPTYSGKSVDTMNELKAEMPEVCFYFNTQLECIYGKEGDENASRVYNGTPDGGIPLPYRSRSDKMHR